VVVWATCRPHDMGLGPHFAPPAEVRCSAGPKDHLFVANRHLVKKLAILHSIKVKPHLVRRLIDTPRYKRHQVRLAKPMIKQVAPRSRTCAVHDQATPHYLLYSLRMVQNVECRPHMSCGELGVSSVYHPSCLCLNAHRRRSLARWYLRAVNWISCDAVLQ
jgi:hypothetical protein